MVPEVLVISIVIGEEIKFAVWVPLVAVKLESVALNERSRSAGASPIFTCTAVVEVVGEGGGVLPVPQPAKSMVRIARNAKLTSVRILP
jgi:hypothetical protein